MAGIYKVFHHSCARGETKIIQTRELSGLVVYFCPGCHLVFMFGFDQLQDEQPLEKKLGDGTHG